MHGCYIFKAIVKLLKSPNWSPNIIQLFFILCFHSPTIFIHLGINILIPFFHLSFIHFSSHDYIHPSIHPSCPFIGNSSNIYPCFIKFSICAQVFTSMFFIHATFIIHSSSIHVSIIHFSSKIKKFPSCLPFMLTYSPNNVHVDLLKTSQKFIIQ